MLWKQMEKTIAKILIEGRSDKSCQNKCQSVCYLWESVRERVEEEHEKQCKSNKYGWQRKEIVTAKKYETIINLNYVFY